MLGVEYDLQAKPPTKKLPREKVLKAADVIKAVLLKVRVGFELIEALFGLLMFCALVLERGALHLNWTLKAMNVARRAGDNSVGRFEAWEAELRWWLVLLSEGNEKQLVAPKIFKPPEHSGDDAPFTDASRSVEKGGVLAAGFVVGGAPSGSRGTSLRLST